ncbi:MAG TPA: nucleotide sugar dehydrogenase [Anaerolineales bacterium]|nr:nucleotide sugar dehydrogenase [Anaerolineales bacterium]
MKFEKVCVIGLGYIGLPTACMLANRGLKVLGVDINPQIIETLQGGGLHIHEPGLQALVQEATSSGNLMVSEQPEDADAFIIAVPTPFYEDRNGMARGASYRMADMRSVSAAAEAILPHLKRGNLVVLESTSPPRTTLDLVKPILDRSGLKPGVDYALCYSPERVLPGQILRELVENARVIGGVGEVSAKAGQMLYAHFVTGEIVLTDATTAEMVKLMENTYRDINIAIANEFSQLAEHLGVDIWEAIACANRHPRVKILRPGPGVGGHCISVDPWFLVEAAPEITPLIHTARQVNDGQPYFTLEFVRRVLGRTITDKRIAVLGLAFKPNVDDIRESPAIDVAHLLVSAGAKVTAYEPFKPDAKVEGVQMAESLEAALADAEAVILLVGHTPFLELKPEDVAKMTPARVMMDCVGGWKLQEWWDAGFQFFRLGDRKNI